MKKVNWQKVFIATALSGVTFALISIFLNYLFSSLYLTTPAIWRTVTGVWLLGMVVYYFLFALFFVLVYALLYTGIPNTGLLKGITYGFLVFLLLGLKSFAVNYISTTLPLDLILIWVIGLAINLLVMGVICGLIYQK